MNLGQAYKALSAFFGVLALLAGLLFIRMKWSGSSDFDVTGFLWLVTNGPRLVVLLCCLVLVGIAISYWVRSWRAGG
jgi:hypothetical protein